MIKSLGGVSLTNYMPVTPLSHQHATTILTWLILTYITTILVYKPQIITTPTARGTPDQTPFSASQTATGAKGWITASENDFSHRLWRIKNKINIFLQIDSFSSKHWYQPLPLHSPSRHLSLPPQSLYRCRQRHLSALRTWAGTMGKIFKSERKFVKWILDILLVNQISWSILRPHNSFL